ncbi:alpha-L-arabinofuranosidase [Lachnotalea glycerini]|nr:alpha-L-arabinofuranosidase [Lachnotalea glycerini]
MICASLALTLISSVMSFTTKPVEAALYSAYVMGYFKETPNGSGNSPNLYLAVSKDGLNWTPLNQNNYVLKPTEGTGYLRDPFFLRKQDGTFVIVATDNWNSEYIHIWDSANLTDFTNERLVRMNTSGMHAWAPETFYDASKGQYAVIWSGNTDRNRIYVNYTKDFVNFTSPKVYFDPGFSVIDGHMEVNVNGYNYLYYKSEKDFKLYGTKSTSLESGSFNSNTYTSGYGPNISGSHIEAPIIMKSLTSNTWWLWGDSYNPVNAVFYAWQTNDLTSNSWTAIDRKDYNAPLNSKHATIAAITLTEYNNLIAKWGAPEWNRLKSYNYPDRYIRHANYTGRIDSAPFDPTSNMQWKIVPGLADSGGVSFQSVDNPSMYLRQSSYNVVLASKDNTTAFKNDATFYMTNGFADSSWTSFQSYTYPGYYIRHSNYVLKLSQITNSSSVTDKQDSTFKICY